MSTLREVLQHARTRVRVSIGDRLYLAYCAILVLIIVVAPIVRAIWLVTIKPSVTAALLATPLRSVIAVAFLLVGLACTAGAVWGLGPRPPWLASLLASSPLTRVQAFRGSVAREIALIATGLGVLLALVTLPLAVAGAISPLACALAVCTAIAVGAVCAVAMLAAQRLRFAGRMLGVLLLALALLGFTLPLPAGDAWLSSFAELLGTLIVCVLAATACLVWVPRGLRSLHTNDIVGAALRRNSTFANVTMLDTPALAAIVQAPPTRGRHLRAIPSAGPMWVVVLRRSAIGWLRTPDRAAMSVIGIAAAVLVQTTTLTLSPWAGLLAGAMWYLSLTSLTAVVDHLAASNLHLPLYGRANAVLLLWHALLPLGFIAMIGAGAWLINPALGLTTALIGALALLARVSNAAKAPLPLELLAPMPTPAGDASVLFRIAWSIDGLLLSALCGAAIAFGSTAWTLILAGVIAAVAYSRWRRG